MKKLILPQVRQTYDYDCGANALQTVLVYYGIEVRSDQVMKYAKTSKKGTPIQGVVAAAQRYGLKTHSKEMTVEELKGYIDRKIPVIILLQAWVKKKGIRWIECWDENHYVVAIGYTKDKVIFEDPSSFVHAYLRYGELEKRWHNADTDGRRYFHHGIAVFGKRPKFRPSKMIHLD